MLNFDILYKDMSNTSKSFNNNDDIFIFTVEDNLKIDLNNFFYINTDDNNEDVLKSNIKDALWRLISKDNVSALPKDSFLNKYKCTKESKQKLIDSIAKIQNIQKDSKQYQDLIDTLKTNEEEFIYPLYNYPRNTLVKSKLNTTKFMSGLPVDSMSLVLKDANNNDDYKKLTEEKEKIEFLNKNYIYPYKGTILDQYHEVLFYLKQNLTLLNPYMNVIRFIDPSCVHFPIRTDLDLVPTYNLINGNNPFPLLLETVQFIHINNKLSLVMNFNSFNIGNLFDVLFGMVLLLIASHESQVEIDKIIINSPYYYVAKTDYEYFRQFDLTSQKRFKISFKPGTKYMDFTTAEPYMFVVEKV